MIHFPIIMLFNCLIFWINICKRANHIWHSYVRCSMNHKNHFTTIKLPGTDPEQSLQIPVIRMSLWPEQTDNTVSHVYQQILSNTAWKQFHRLLEYMACKWNRPPIKPQLAFLSCCEVFFYATPLKYWTDSSAVARKQEHISA